MISPQKMFLVGIIAMAVIITASNILVAYPINAWLTWAAFTYPITFFITDMSNRLLGVHVARRIVFFGFICGVVLSLYLADLRIAIASGSAFLIAQLLDVVIFDRLRSRAWWHAPLFSSLISSAIDTMLFFWIAFVGTALPWFTLGLGDYSAKLLVALTLLLPFRMLSKWLQPLVRTTP